MPEARTPFGRDIVHALHLVEDQADKLGRDRVPGPLRLRAARALWLINDIDAASVEYKRAATQLMQEARTIGRQSFTYAGLMELAMGAAKASRDRQTLRDVCGDVLAAAQAIDPPAASTATSQTRSDDPLIRAVYAMAKVRAHWYLEQFRELKTPPDQAGKDELFRRMGETEGWIPRLIRLAGLPPTLASLVPGESMVTRGTLEGAARDLWMSSRGPRSLAMIKAASESAQRDLENDLMHPDAGILAWLRESAAKPPTIMDVVDEELISVVEYAQRVRLRLPKIPVPVQAGTLASDVM